MTSNERQAALWNGAAGHHWVQSQPLLDALFAPLERVLADALPAGSGGRLLDVGCGTGATTLAAARRLGAGARCTGIDLSAPMIDLARERAAREGATGVDFVAADAQVHGFEPGVFDHLVSRFGVMFFDDPVRAFANLRRAAAPGAALNAVVWRSAAENPFMTTAERAAAPLLPDLAARGPEAPGTPGQFAFADAQRVTGLLADAGWSGIDIRSLDVTCGMPRRELPRYAAQMGPVGLRLQQADAATRAAVLPAIESAFAPFVQGDELRFTAACWRLRAVARG